MHGTERRLRPHDRRRGRLAAHGAAPAHLPARQQPRVAAVPPDQRSARPLHARRGPALPPHLRLARRHERAARHHAVPAADRRPRRVLRAAADARAQHHHRVRPRRRPRGRLRRQQLRRRERPDRRRRRAQGHALHPLLQPLQHADDLPRGRLGLHARHRAGDARHHPRGPAPARRDHRPARAVDDADHPQRLRRRVRRLQLALHRRRRGVRDAARAHRRDGRRRGGREFVFKDELRALDVEYRKAVASGTPEAEARRARDAGWPRSTSATSAS